MEAQVSQQQAELIRDYIAFHLHSPLNSAQDDYRHFNHVLFNAFKLNLFYTLGVGAVYFQLLFSRKRGVLRGFISPRRGAVVLLGYCSLQYYNRVRRSIYSQESLECALKYQTEVERYNDHFRRLYGNR